MLGRFSTHWRNTGLILQIKVLVILARDGFCIKSDCVGKSAGIMEYME